MVICTMVMRVFVTQNIYALPSLACEVGDAIPIGPVLIRLYELFNLATLHLRGGCEVPISACEVPFFTCEVAILACEVG